MLGIWLLPLRESAVYVSAPDPIAVRTTETESLSGYVQRLAEWHETNPGQLFHRILLHDAAGDRRFVGRWRYRGGVLWLPSNNNGFGHADAWLKALRCLVHRADLQHLTTRSWDEVFPTRHFLSTLLRWCPHCLSDDRVPYHRLLWALSPVAVCRLHRCVLSERCVACGRTLWVLHHRSRVNRCPHCAADLRRTADDPVTVASDDPRMHDADELADLVVTAPSIAVHPRRITGAYLRRCVRRAGIRTPAELGRATGITKSTAWYWWMGKVVPSLPVTLRLGRVLGMPLASLVLGRPRDGTSGRAAPVQIELSLRYYRSARKLDWGGIRTALLASLAVPSAEAKSLAAIARDLEVDRRTLRVHEPEICRQICARFLVRRSKGSVARDTQLRGQIRSAVEALAQRGLACSDDNVAAELGRPGLFSRSAARRAFVEIVAGDKAPWPHEVTFPRAHCSWEMLCSRDRNKQTRRER